MNLFRDALAQRHPASRPSTPDQPLPYPPDQPFADTVQAWTRDLYDTATVFDHRMAHALGRSAATDDPLDALAWTRVAAVFGGLGAALRDAALDLEREARR